MATIHLQVSEELMAELRGQAAARGKTVEELAAEALTRGLQEPARQDPEEHPADVIYGRRKRR